jgi:hypothetical protein
MTTDKSPRADLEDAVADWTERLDYIAKEIGAFTPGSRDLSVTKTHIDNAIAWLDHIYLRLGTEPTTK